MVVSGGFPHLYSHAVAGSAVDASAVRSVANADVAELHAALEPAIAIDDNVHLINVATKRALTATEFKQMFYDCPSSTILEIGSRKCSTILHICSTIVVNFA